MATDIVRARSGAEMPVVTPSRALDRHREIGAVARGIALRHQWQTKLLDPFTRKSEANQTATMRGHKIYRVRGRHLRRNHKISLVFAILVIDEDEHATVTGIVDDILDRRQNGEVLLGAPGNRRRGGMIVFPGIRHFQLRCIRRAA